MAYKINILIGFVFISFLSSCTKEEGEPTNPYDAIGNSSIIEDTTNVDSNSIGSIHQDILLPKCSTPGCHDGSFEPDFRTINSSYSTLVYHPILKNNDSLDFEFRVVPFLPEQSVLYERITNCCFVNQDDRMPQDQIGVPLPNQDILRIRKWIENGAQDYQGDITLYPNQEVIMKNFALHDASDYPKTGTVVRYSDKEFRIDTTTSGSAMVLDTGLHVFLHFVATDDSTLAQDLSNVRIEFSYQKEDFSSTFKTVNGIHYPANDKWHFLFDINDDFISDTTIYIRAYANDGDHSSDTEYPNYNSSNYQKDYWSMRVKY